MVNISSKRNVPTQLVNPHAPDLNGLLPCFRSFSDTAFRVCRRAVGKREAQSLGSGFIIPADGYVLTNNHVVADVDEITVRLPDRSEFEATLVGADARTDIALLKMEVAKLPTVRLGQSSSLKAGEWVLAIGSPFGFDHAVTAGIVSAVGRKLPNESYVPFIQTDVAINPIGTWQILSGLIARPVRWWRRCCMEVPLPRAVCQ